MVYPEDRLLGKCWAKEADDRGAYGQRLTFLSVWVYAEVGLVFMHRNLGRVMNAFNYIYTR